MNQYVWPVLLPILTAVSSALAGASAGVTRGIWISLGVVAVAGNAILSVIKARQAERAKEHEVKLAQVAADAKARLATALSSAGNPLVVGLADLASVKPGDACREKLSDFTKNITAVAASQCSRSAVDRTRVRAVYYAFAGAGTRKLELIAHRGRDGDVPGQAFSKDENEYSSSIIRTASGRNTVRYPNLEEKSPGGFEAGGRTFRSFVAVPVRAGDTAIGLLTADSDEVNIFTQVEEGYLRLLAGLLAAATSHSRSNS
jgi:putative methionine-R-sulfoxide reductase with GAF domain